MIMILKKICRRIHKKWVLFLVNKIYKGTTKFKRKRKLLNSIGYQIGEGSKIVGPIEVTGKLIVGENCWIGKNFKVNGNGTVTIGDNCDIAPEVTFQTGGHAIGNCQRRAGKGKIFNQSVGDRTWIGGRVTILNETEIGKSCVIAGCACVIGDVPDNSLVGGVPARLIRVLDD